VTPDEFTAFAAYGEALGIPHVEASPLTRSSHHAQASYAKASNARASHERVVAADEGSSTRLEPTVI
jgi:lipoic acid synthetase